MTRARLVPALLVAALLVGAANLGAFAATGGPLLLGKSNTATKTTKLKTTGNGPALGLKTKASAPPLKVSSSTKVAKLNADLVDGLDGDALRTKTYVYNLNATAVTEGYVSFALPGLPPGQYLVDLAVSAATTGTPSIVGCFVVSGTAGAPDFRVPVAALADTVNSALWFVSASGYVDTRTVTHRVACQRTGGTDMTIPNPSYPGTASFTRIGSAVVRPSTGAGTASPRPLAP